MIKNSKLYLDAIMVGVTARQVFYDFGNLQISLDSYHLFFLEILDDENIPYEYILDSHYSFLEFQNVEELY